jgi:hypothetical protein
MEQQHGQGSAAISSASRCLIKARARVCGGSNPVSRDLFGVAVPFSNWSGSLRSHRRRDAFSSSQDAGQRRIVPKVAIRSASRCLLERVECHHMVVAPACVDTSRSYSASRCHLSQRVTPGSRSVRRRDAFFSRRELATGCMCTHRSRDLRRRRGAFSITARAASRAPPQRRRDLIGVAVPFRAAARVSQPWASLWSRSSSASRCLLKL